ncbi:hypothetical protein K491DRAFT_703363 [Lophiostoma macrostomum CBS 122681]|uniref:GIY-YIG domain-containing protein n=1 Tax=Lophiostoma macrostomum CBS 122681 TaxID=1314788 RepID=A0A6A6TCF6_9PLEO|nr:hypothetical protein K491DRAFT_703363 [Lophiostoma macrostomum CBS 122681]
MVQQKVLDALRAFVAERDWAQFHTSENLAKSIAKLDFSKDAVTTWKALDERHANWPVVYVLDNGPASRSSRGGLRDVYVGESLNAAGRMQQHLKVPGKQHLKNVRIVLHEKFNKSVCLDLESYLIRMMAGDGANQVLNRNNGITEAQYYQRDAYREGFRTVFEHLKAEGVFTRSVYEIENSDMFKLSPFKALTEDQANSVEEIMRRLFIDMERGERSTMVIQGDPGTGKTVVAIYLIKLLVDIKSFNSLEDLDSDSQFADFFTRDHQGLLQDLKIGLVVPQQSLRSTIQIVFRKTQGLHPSMVLDPFKAGEAEDLFDLLLVDETHRLNQRASQPSAVLNSKFRDINEKLFGFDDVSRTQLDWIRAKSRHQIYLLDAMQSVRPADLPAELLSNLVADTRSTGRHFQLRTQMRVQAGSDFVSYIRWILDPVPLSVPRTRLHFGDYDFRMFDSVAEMRDEILRRDADVGLSRMVAGYAWEWKTKKDKDAFDIEIDQVQLRWNSTPTDWVSSRNALAEVGSVHTIQGYDLNYVGVIIGKQNNRALGTTCSNDDLLRFITQIYAVLLTRGIRGTYVYACDQGLREYLRGFIPSTSGHPSNSALLPTPARRNILFP